MLGYLLGALDGRIPATLAVHAPLDLAAYGREPAFQVGGDGAFAADDVRLRGAQPLHRVGRGVGQPEAVGQHDGRVQDPGKARGAHSVGEVVVAGDDHPLASLGERLERDGRRGLCRRVAGQALDRSWLFPLETREVPVITRRTYC